MVSPRAVYFRLEILCILNFGVPALVWTMFVRMFLRGLPEAENGTGGPDESNGIQRTLKYV